MKKILFVEDNAHKRNRVREYILSLEEDVEVEEAHSYTSGSRKLEESQFDLFLLDVSLPTYDRVGAESGGRFRVFGGREIARKIFRRSACSKIAFVTQFDSFSDKGNSYTFAALQAEISDELGDSYKGMIFYGSSISSWRDEIGKIIKDL